jgi:hypothetical protein
MRAHNCHPGGASRPFRRIGGKYDAVLYIYTRSASGREAGGGERPLDTADLMVRTSKGVQGSEYRNLYWCIIKLNKTSRAYMHALVLKYKCSFSHEPAVADSRPQGRRGRARGHASVIRPYMALGSVQP